MKGVKDFNRHLVTVLKVSTSVRLSLKSEWIGGEESFNVWMKSLPEQMVYAYLSKKA